MSAANTPPPFVRAKVTGADLRVSAYDQASGMLISLLMLVGFCVGAMFVIWLSSRVWISTTAVPVTMLEEEPGGGGNGGTAGEQLEEPPKDEVIEVIDPPVEVTLEAITDVVSTQVANMENFTPVPTGQGRGTGDGRGVGPGGDGTADIIPRWERWDIRYSTSSIEMYARQLDTFGVELGVVGGGRPDIDYAIGFSGGKPKKRTGPSADEKRLYFTWKSGSLIEADQTLLAQAGIETKKRIMVQFYSKDVENSLAVLEKQYAGDRDVRGIRRTVFGVRPKGNTLEYFVMDQTYRTFQP